MLEQHRLFAAEVTERFRRDETVEALLVAGSVAHGLARPDSDLDVMVVVSAEEVERRTAAHAVTFYEDGDLGLDGKAISRAFVAEVAERGSEPARWAFTDAIVAFAREPGLEELVRSAGRYPEAERDEKLRNFVAHALLMRWFHGEAAKRRDPYLAAYASSRLVLYAGRAILAHNRLLYPSHKWFRTMVERAPERPGDLLERMDAALAAPSAEHAELLTSAVVETVGVDVPLAEAASRFTEQSEWGWRRGPAALDES